MADSRSERSNLKPARSERPDLMLKRPDLWLKRPDLRPDRPERPVKIFGTVARCLESR